MKARVPILGCALAILSCGCAGPRVAEHRPPVEIWSLAPSPSPGELVLFDNGQCVKTARSPESTEPGLRGYWRRTASGAIAVFEDGSALTLRWNAKRASWKNGLSGARSGPWHDAAAITNAPEAGWIGLWRLNPEPDNRYFYVQLHADGSAESSLAGSGSGSWKPWHDGALCVWPGGWRDWIARGASGYVKRSWPPGSALAEDASDTSIALRVGEQPFTAAP